MTKKTPPELVIETGTVDAPDPDLAVAPDPTLSPEPDAQSSEPALEPPIETDVAVALAAARMIVRSAEGIEVEVLDTNTIVEVTHAEGGAPIRLTVCGRPYQHVDTIEGGRWVYRHDK